MGITPEKWQGIRAEREAYERMLGPTLAEQLQDPTFLATLDPVARPFYVRPKEMNFEFAIPSKPVYTKRTRKTRLKAVVSEHKAKV